MYNDIVVVVVVVLASTLSKSIEDYIRPYCATTNIDVPRQKDNIYGMQFSYSIKNLNKTVVRNCVEFCFKKGTPFSRQLLQSKKKKYLISLLTSTTITMKIMVATRHASISMQILNLK